MLQMKLKQVIDAFVLINCLGIVTAYHFHVENQLTLEFESYRLMCMATTTHTPEIPCQHHCNIERIAADEATNDLITDDEEKPEDHALSVKKVVLDKIGQCVDKHQEEEVCLRSDLLKNCIREAAVTTIMHYYDVAEQCAFEANFTNFDYMTELQGVKMSMRYNFVSPHACFHTCFLRHLGLLTADDEVDVAFADGFFQRFDIDFADKLHKCNTTVPAYIQHSPCATPFWVAQCAYGSALKKIGVERQLLRHLEFIGKFFD